MKLDRTTIPNATPRRSRPARDLPGRTGPLWRCVPLLVPLLLGPLPSPAQAQATPATAATSAATTSAATHQRSLAATCAHCHGGPRQAAGDDEFPRLAGRPAAELYAQLLAFRSGERRATVMQQLAKGYTPEQLQSIADYFAAQK